MAHPGHETRDVNLRGVLWVTAGICGVVVLSLGLMWALLDRLQAYEARTSPPASPLAATYGPKEPPTPHLQTHPRRDLDTFRAEQEAILDGYGWVDREAGRVRIPIARAMDLLVERGP